MLEIFGIFKKNNKDKEVKVEKILEQIIEAQEMPKKLFKAIEGNIESLLLLSINSDKPSALEILIKPENEKLIYKKYPAYQKNAVQILRYAAEKASKYSIETNPYANIMKSIFEIDLIKPNSVEASDLAEMLKELAKDKNILGVSLILSHIKEDSLLIDRTDASLILNAAVCQNYTEEEIKFNKNLLGEMLKDNDKEIDPHEYLIDTILNSLLKGKMDFINDKDMDGIIKRAENSKIKEIIDNFKEKNENYINSSDSRKITF